ncbi:hypothetical protein OAory_01039890 [Aspergillus oryzae]|uniref:Unnamed protein product n=1 Tax=Aspergillus oryzae TaxID=5062 RepID=A0A1S9DEN8_ASPOZ|nr:hypothetical protein OAory_01039890 [Aspergillus oryzae]GMG25507.1 unnamed protein product [Aspergillus oryzae]
MTARTSDRTSNTQPIIYSSASTTSQPTLTDSSIDDDIEIPSSILSTTTESSLTSFVTPLNPNLISFEDELSSYVGTVTDSWTEWALDPELGFDNSISDNIAPNLDLDIPQTPWEHDNEHGNLIIRGPTILLTTLKQKTVPTFLKKMGYSAPIPLSKNPVVRNFDLNINESKNDSPPWSPYTLSTRLLALERYIEDKPGTRLSTIYPPIETWGRRKVGYRAVWCIDRVFRFHGICIRGFGVDVACVSGLVGVPVVLLQADREAPVRAWRGAVRDVGLAGLWDLGIKMGRDGEGIVEVDVDVDFGCGGLDVDGLFSSSSPRGVEERVRECLVYLGGRG